MYITKHIEPNTTHIDLLHVVDEYGDGHFVYIKDFGKLMGTGGKHKGYYCKHCLSEFTSHESLCNHYKMSCYVAVGTLELMPIGDQSVIEYTSKGYEEYAPFVVENDVGCLSIQHTTTARNNTTSYIDTIPTQEPN